MRKVGKVFKTGKRIRLGIWGLGRGMSFFKTCESLNIDVVAGCDYNGHMRKNFLENSPGSFVTDDVDEFLRQDIDAVLVATFCPAHADDAIKCLRAGKHVLSEVTAFHTMAEGVRLAEEVEKSGKVYNLAENYPFTAANMYLAEKWKEGLFGDLMYAEYEYVHECRSLCYTYIDGKPVEPGNTVHNWRSWINFQYYCTHSLGPIMVITGTRPTRVETFPGKQRLAGYPCQGDAMGGISPSLIQMSNGSVVRNLMGATTNDTHVQRIWGTLGAAEINVGKELQLRLGGSGSSPKFEVRPKWPKLQDFAGETGHGGGDFWVLYYFARQILTGEPGPFGIYPACDVTIPGILARRSELENGKPFDVPDFRNRKERDMYRNDNDAQPHFDVKKGIFPADANPEITLRFTGTMKDLIAYSLDYRAYADWKKVAGDMADPKQILPVAEKAVANCSKMVECYKAARKIADAYPKSVGARALREMLEIGNEQTVKKPGFPKQLKRELAELRRKIKVKGNIK